jgi:hypothetical protein
VRRTFLHSLCLSTLLVSCGVPQDEATPETPPVEQVRQPLGHSSFDSTLRVPACPWSDEGCTTLDDVRASGWHEYNSPNTLSSACADGQNAARISADQIEYLRIEPADGSLFFMKGKTARFTATAWVTHWGMNYDKIELYHTADVTNPRWTLLKTVTPNTVNLVDAVATFVLPAGTRQAVRARMRPAGAGTAGPCGTGGSDDHDDLVFNVNQGDTTPPNVSITKPAPGQGVQGTFVILEASAVDQGGTVTKVEFLVGGTLVGTDTTLPSNLASLAWDSRAYAPGNYTLTAKAYDASGNVATSAPVSFTLTPDTTPPTVSLSAPASGATVSSAVTFNADAYDEFGVTHVEYYVAGTRVASRTAPKWDSTTVPNGSYAVEARAYDANGNVGVSSPMTVTVSNAASLATYDATVKAPFCATPRETCDTGTLLVGKGTLDSPQTAEFRQPNTVDGCQDGAAGTFHVEESVEQLKVTAVNGGELTAGQPVRVDAKVWTRSPPWGARVDIYSAPVASGPAWRHIATLSPSAAGEQWLSTQFTLPAGAQQVVRARIRDGGTSGPCGSAFGYDDHDDVVFAVAPGTPDTQPPSVSIAYPDEGSVVSGTVTIMTIASDNTLLEHVRFYEGGYMLGIVTAPPYIFNWNTATSAPGTKVLRAVARDGAGLETTVLRTVVLNDTTPPTVSLTAPANGSTVSGTVTLTATASDSGSVARVEFYVDGALLGTDSLSPYSLGWNTAGLTGSHTLQARAYDAAGNMATSSTVTVTVGIIVNTTALYDATLKVPRCSGPVNRCDSGTLLNGRGNLGPEPNQPNTLQGSCADGASGSYHSDESNDAIRVSTVDGTPFATGKTVRIDVKVWAYSSYGSDKLDLYYTANANSPSWTFIGTLSPAGGGTQTLTTTYTLPAGTLQAVRARFRYGGSAGACGTGGYDDHDDLAFDVAL